MKLLLSWCVAVLSAASLLGWGSAASAQTNEEFDRASEEGTSLSDFCVSWTGIDPAEAGVENRAFMGCWAEGMARLRYRIARARVAEREATLYWTRPAELDSECTGTFTHLTRYAYQVSGRQMAAIRVTGSYRLPGGAGRFSIVDDDGFFTIASVVSRWQSIGPNIPDFDTLRIIPRSDLELVRAASMIGVQYYEYILSTYSAPRLGQSAEDFDAFRADMTERRDYMRNVSLATSAWLERSPGVEALRLLRTDIHYTISTFLERFNNPALQASYVDLERPSRLYALCQDGAVNPAIGQLVCSRSFLDNEMYIGVSGWRDDELFCPDGILIAPLPRLCDETAGMNCEFGTSA